MLMVISAASAQQTPALGIDVAGEFAFVRIQYDSYYGGGFYGGPWLTDFPASDQNFLRGVSRLTNVRVMDEPIVLRFDDEEIFDYPFLYALEMGNREFTGVSAAGRISAD
jgi:hypothetical protein